jgi:hypothetical protein
MGQGTRSFSLRHKLHAVSKTSFFHFCFLLILLCCVPPATAQDSPGRYEVGGNFTVLRNAARGSVGPGLEGDFNFGRHFALDAALSWLPDTTPGLRNNLTQGLFGAKVGTRTQHFGFFGKVRPGFVSIRHVLREQTLVFSGINITPTVRFARLTERAIDFGGVFEYYPSKHWALRYDMGDTVIFEEEPRFIVVNSPSPLLTSHIFPNQTRNRFQFSTSVHYRF